MEIRISRLDYKNRTDIGALPVLPSLTSINEINDINEVHAISLTFDTIEEAKLVASKFPKYLNVRVGDVRSYENNITKIKYSLSKQFNTFWMNDVTKGKNETAIKNRLAFIKTIKSL